MLHPPKLELMTTNNLDL